MKGLSWDMYPNDKKAASVADEFIEHNRQEYPHILELDNHIIESTADPLKATEFYFVFHQGMLLLSGECQPHKRITHDTALASTPCYPIPSTPDPSNNLRR